MDKLVEVEVVCWSGGLDVVLEDWKGGVQYWKKGVYVNPVDRRTHEAGLEYRGFKLLPNILGYLQILSFAPLKANFCLVNASYNSFAKHFLAYFIWKPQLLHAWIHSTKSPHIIPWLLWDIPCNIRPHQVHMGPGMSVYNIENVIMLFTGLSRTDAMTSSLTRRNVWGGFKWGFVV